MIARRTCGSQLAPSRRANAVSTTYVELRVALRSRLDGLLAGFPLSLTGSAGVTAESLGGLEARGGAEGGAGDDGGHGGCVQETCGWVVEDGCGGAGCSSSELAVVRCRIAQPNARQACTGPASLRALAEAGVVRHGAPGRHQRTAPLQSCRKNDCRYISARARPSLPQLFALTTLLRPQSLFPYPLSQLPGTSGSPWIDVMLFVTTHSATATPSRP